VNISPLADGDRVSVRVLEMKCVREYVEGALKMNWDELPDETRDSLGASAAGSFQFYRDGGLSFVAKEDGKVIGAVFAQMVSWIDGVDKSAWIENICVDREFRRMGVGYELMRHLALEAKKAGAKTLRSSIGLENTKSLLLHRKLGFLGEDRKTAILDLSKYS